MKTYQGFFNVVLPAPKGALAMFRGIKCQTITEFLRLSEYRKNVKLNIETEPPNRRYLYGIVYGSLAYGGFDKPI